MSLKNVRIGFVGGGAMAEALLGGLLAAGVPAEHLCAADPDPTRRDHLKRRLAIATTGALLLSASLGGCAVPNATDCDRAVDAVETCTGASLEEAPYSATCEPSEAAHAREIVAELDRSGCEGEAPAVDSKADSPLCLGTR